LLIFTKGSKSAHRAVQSGDFIRGYLGDDTSSSLLAVESLVVDAGGFVEAVEGYLDGLGDDRGV
jgi:hypothetical protein